MSVATRSVLARMARTILFSILSVASLWIAFNASESFAAGASMVFQNFDGPNVPVNKAGDHYPTWYQGGPTGTEGGTFTPSIDSNKKIAGAGSLLMHVTTGVQIYAQFNPYDSSDNRGFAREYSSNPSGWKFNTYNRMSYWLWSATNGSPVPTDGSQNWNMGTYVKRITNFDPSSDEAGGDHYYHDFVILNGVWSYCVFNMHPTHRRGDAGDLDLGELPYPTTSAYYGSGDPAATYNYFDTLTRFYIQDVNGGSSPKDYWLDEMKFYQETNVENEKQVYSICASYTAANNRLFLTWNRFKDDNSVNHEVRYAFSDIHALGWNNATPAPNGTITPPGWQGYNEMIYDTKSIDVSGKSMIYLAIKPQNSSLFSQIAFPLTNSPATPPISPPTNLRVLP